MKSVLLILNERALREFIKDAFDTRDHAFTACGTAVQALDHIKSISFDVIVLEAKMFPGMGSQDPVLSDMAAMLPQSKYNEMLLHWQVACRVMEIARESDSRNRLTPLIIKFPLDAESILHSSGDTLNREAVQKDLQSLGPTLPLFEARAVNIIDALRNYS